MSNLEFKDEELARIEDRWKVSFYITLHFCIQWGLLIKTLSSEKLSVLIDRPSYNGFPLRNLKRV